MALLSPQGTNARWGSPWVLCAGEAPQSRSPAQPQREQPALSAWIHHPAEAAQFLHWAQLQLLADLFLKVRLWQVNNSCPTSDNNIDTQKWTSRRWSYPFKAHFGPLQLYPQMPALLTNISTLHPLHHHAGTPPPLTVMGSVCDPQPQKVCFTYWMVILKLLFREKCSSVATVFIFTTGLRWQQNQYVLIV